MKSALTNLLHVVLLLAFLSVTLSAQDAETASPGQAALSQTGRILRLEVHSTTPLGDVLTAFCNEQKIQCAGSEFLSGFPLPSMTVTGTAEEIIATLLQGTEMNYSISRATSGALTKLTVLGHAPAGVLETGGSASLRNGNPELVRQLQIDPMPVSEPESAEESARSERVMELIFGGASKGEDESMGSGENAANGETTLAAKPELPEFLPFPDQFGNPIRTSPSVPAIFLPFPDHNGNPIPVTPVPMTGPPIPLTSH